MQYSTLMGFRTEPSTLPRRGEKDFEPDGTSLQDHALLESRQAMHAALLGERKHSTKTHVEATWDPSLCLSRVKSPRGPHFKTVGRADRNGVLWLLPEETIYLVERGNLECWWEEGIPMSLQGVYASCLDACGGLERYQVYSYLKRAGYILARADTFVDEEGEVKKAETIRPLTAARPGIFAQIFSKLFGPKPAPPHGPVIGKGVYRSYEQIYARLSLIPSHHPPHAHTHPVTTLSSKTPFRVAYQVWKPRPHFRKARPPPADFLVAVVSARETSLPTLAQLAGLFESVPVDANAGGRSQNMRLKEGYRNVIIAIVDAGVTSFIKFADVGFGDELLYKWKPGGARGGKGGGRGRGGKRGGLAQGSVRGR